MKSQTLNADSTPLTRREVLSYAQIAAIVLLVLALVMISGLLFLPQPQWIDLGKLDELKSATPIHRVITVSDGRNISFWIAYIGENKWSVFNGQVPFGTHCDYEWFDVTQRFEDPCSGAKFSLAGEYLDIYTYLIGKTVQNLDRYPAMIQDAHLFIDVNQVIHGEPFIARAPTPECCK